MGQRMNNLTGAEWLALSFSIWRNITKTGEERATRHPALFPQKLAQELIKIYTKDNYETILDPFMGIGSTLLAAREVGRNAIGIELNSDFCEVARARLAQLQVPLSSDVASTEQQIRNGDSRTVLKAVPPESIDMVLTSPPYWDILNQKRTADPREIRSYSTSSIDLGNITDYSDFLQELQQVFQLAYQALRPNKRCISVVMDIRKKDKFYPLHEDQSKIMREIGFELEEYVIWDRQKDYNNMRPLGYPYVFRFNKVHEYICIYWKR